MDRQDIDRVRREFIYGELLYLDAVERLQSMGMYPRSAEALVEEWLGELSRGET